MGVKAVKLATVEVVGDGHTAYEVGQFTPRGQRARCSMSASMWSFGDRRRDSGSCTVISGIAAGQHQDSKCCARLVACHSLAG